MAAHKTLTIVALTLASLLVYCHAEQSSTIKPGAPKGSRFFDWVGKQLPEVSLKMVTCVKKSEKELKDTILNLFTDLGKCFDETKGSALYTAECLLKNSSNRLLSMITVSHKVLGCVLKSKDGRLCVSVTDVKDEHCPFLIGI